MKETKARLKRSPLVVVDEGPSVVAEDGDSFLNALPHLVNVALVVPELVLVVDGGVAAPSIFREDDGRRLVESMAPADVRKVAFGIAYKQNYMKGKSSRTNH